MGGGRISDRLWYMCTYPLSFQDVNKLQLLLKGRYQFRLLFLQLLVFCQQLLNSLMLLFASILPCVSMCEKENLKKKKQKKSMCCGWFYVTR